MELAHRAPRCDGSPAPGRALADLGRRKAISNETVNYTSMRIRIDIIRFKVIADISTDPGQIDFSGPALKIKQSGLDALLAYLPKRRVPACFAN
jgi:hypothetical protein